jgi:phospholipase C
MLSPNTSVPRKFSPAAMMTMTIVLLVATTVLLSLPTQLAAQNTATPIKHVVVIFQENVSFDHYFATYPFAMNPAGEPKFTPRKGTPTVNGLLTGGLLAQNPNSGQPFRLDRSQAATCDMDHEYTDEQKSFDAGLMDKFLEFTGVGGPGCIDYGFGKRLVMGYFDGNTTTAFWNYAQHFAMSDNSYNTTFGPSTPGALNLISGQTHGIIVDGPETIDGTVIGDPQPQYDDCTTRDFVGMTGTNVGDLLSAKGITWGWFQGGFRPSSVVAGKAHCDTAHTGSDGNPKKDYIPHHEPFQYYPSTANPHHLPPTSVALIGTNADQANHQYDLVDFWAAADSGHMPAVTFLKARGFQDGHAGYSDPLAEQTFIVETINHLESLEEWEHTAVIIAYDDSDGWYDHVMSPIVSQSNTTADALTGPGSCGMAPAGAFQGRCGYGPRLPLIVVSPFAKVNFVDHSITDQSSILLLIEDNWKLGKIGDPQSFDVRAGSLFTMFDFRHRDDDEHARKLFLDPSTGEPVRGDGDGDRDDR